MKFQLVLGAHLLVASILAGSARAQGTDDCSAATAISGLGTFSVSTIGATDSPQQSGTCPTAHRDVWFAWTASVSGGTRFSFCGGATTDTVLAAYNGATCPTSGTSIACNDDSCGLQSLIAFVAVAGNTYMIQAGHFSSSTYTATLLVDQPGPPANDGCSTPSVASGTGPFSFDLTYSTTGAEGQAESACNFAGGTAIARDVWFTWTAGFTNATTYVDTCSGTVLNTKIAVYLGAGCPSGPALACSDDVCGTRAQTQFSAVLGQTYTIQLGLTASGSAGGTGTFRITTNTGGCPSPSIGPDVIVGDITDVLNAAPVAGIDAIALGTNACNIGNAPLSWQASTNLHPVIGSTLYRYKIVNGAGRFEELGMSWLKHAFAAASGSFCCPCTPSSGSLGIGCSDPYGAGLNGSQSGLGPRWQVNASNGVYTFPPANPSWTGTVARRCQVALADLEVTGGTNTTRFFGETTYVNQDDAQAGNGENNASYREMTVSGGPGDFSLGLTGSTQRQLQALRAWPVVEPGVVMSEVRVAGDGLYLVGSHATNLGGGIYHYEFAVLNMNGDRNVGTFSVPVPPTATITNIGFHDVAYHDGDGPGNVNFSGVDWPATAAGGAVTWACEPQAVNASANAIRWSSTYNFRFDADVAPASGFVSLGLWKPGTPTNVNAWADVPGGAARTFAYCFGDGTGTPCPCGNASAVGADEGCLSSFGSAGRLVAGGTPSISADTFRLTGSGMPNAPALYFQGTAQENGGAGSVFGDGLRCAGGTVIRLGTKTNAGGSSTYPGSTDPSISVRGLDSAGDVRTYQVWYRNIAAFCQPDGFNLTNGVQTTWAP